MTQNNMPDVLFVNENPENMGSEFIAERSNFRGGVEFIRKGAPSPWIDPAKQPIPDYLYLDTPAYVKRMFNDREICLLLDVDRAKDLFRDGLLIGYIILPPE